MNNPDFVFVKRLKDGQIMDIPKRDLVLTLKRGFVLWQEPEVQVVIPKTDITTSPTEPINVLNKCQLCEKEYKSEKALEKHMNTHR